jgi:hypothetical protein
MRLIRAPPGAVRRRRQAAATPARAAAAAPVSMDLLSQSAATPLNRRGASEVTFAKVTGKTLSSTEGALLKNRVVSSVSDLSSAWRIAVPTGLVLLDR